MKKLLLILLCVPLMFSCGESEKDTKIQELEKKIEELEDKFKIITNDYNTDNINVLDLVLPIEKTTKKLETISIHIKDVEGDIVKTPNFYIDIGSGLVLVEFENIEDRLKSAIKEDMEEFKGITLYTDKTVAVKYVSNIMLIASKNDYKIALAVSQE